jgi:hypothetical protein
MMIFFITVGILWYVKHMCDFFLFKSQQPQVFPAFVNQHTSFTHLLHTSTVWPPSPACYPPPYDDLFTYTISLPSPK